MLLNTRFHIWCMITYHAGADPCYRLFPPPFKDLESAQSDPPLASCELWILIGFSWQERDVPTHEYINSSEQTLSSHATGANPDSWHPENSHVNRVILWHFVRQGLSVRQANKHTWKGSRPCFNILLVVKLIVWIPRWSTTNEKGIGPLLLLCCFFFLVFMFPSLPIFT